MKNADQNNEIKSIEVSKSLKSIVQLEANFLSIIIQCTDDLFDWLSLDELAALNLTCKKLQQLTSDYYHRKYLMKCLKIGQLYGTNDIQFRCRDKSVNTFEPFVRSLVVLPSTECLEYLKSTHTKDLVSVSFYDGEILDTATDALAELMKNVEIIEIQYGSIYGEFHESFLKFCSRIKQLIIKYGFNECENIGIENQWLLNEYPTLEHFHWSAGSLPDNLDTFFHLNPNIRTFNASIYTAMSSIIFLIDTGLKFDELYLEVILELHEDEHEGMEVMRISLNTLYERKQIKSLMLQFIFCSQLLDPEWGQLEYLHGAYVDFPRQPGSTKALSALVHLKLLVLGINTVLSRAKASILARHLVNLEEIYIQISSIHAIIPFIRCATKLHKIYVYKTADGNEFNGKIKGINALNKDRMNLQNACKTMVFLPDKAYCQIKWQSHQLNYPLIEIKRSESHILRQPFATTILRRDICELYEKF